MVGVAAGRLATTRRMPARYWVALGILAMLPDADALGMSFGIPYGHAFGHRGFFHSLCFALLAGAGTGAILFRERWLRTAVLFLLVTASHGLLDALTNGGLGVAFFAPFDNGRHFLPVTPLTVPPIGILSFFSAWGAEVLASEAVWVWTPLAALLLVVECGRAARRSTMRTGG